MNYRKLGKTGYKISEIGFGGWAIGADWGEVSRTDAIKALETAIEQGVNFIDTADVYGDGRSERIIRETIAKLDSSKKDKVYIATKAGRRLDPHVSEGYNFKNIEKFVDRSLKNLDVDSLDLLQLHCPPTDVYYKPEFILGLNKLIEKGKIKSLGVSVEKVEEALKAIEYDNISTVQIIFNIFRQRPTELFFEQAKKRDIGIICRVPLASGLLTGKMSKDTIFSEDDHRNYNRNGDAFDVGETFAGVDFEKGLEAVDELKEIKPDKLSMVDLALRWILDHDEISTVIPGCKNKLQALDNTKVSEINKLSSDTHNQIKKIYDKYFKPMVHHRW
jgi:aryl-alcohol dehydrogenase-like predicted oxidoreductase